MRPPRRSILVLVRRIMPPVRKTHRVPANSADIGQRVDRLVQRLCGWSRAQVQGLFDHGCVRVNGSECRFAGQRAAADDAIELRYDSSRKYHPQPKRREHPGFDIAYEDDDLLVVLKPPELLTVPTERGETNTLVDRVSRYVRRHGARQAYSVHRLDRGVSGLLVFGKSAEVAQKIRDQFAKRKPQREYAAIVAGVLKDDRGTRDTLLATTRDLKRYSTDDEEIGQRAVTHYEVLRRLDDATYVRVWLETGRRNQIRVHFAEIGHPVLGDPRYEPEQAAHRHWPYKRLALHARRLGFIHPTTGRKLSFDSPLPVEMDRFLTRR